MGRECRRASELATAREEQEPHACGERHTREGWRHKRVRSEPSGNLIREEATDRRY